MHALKLIVETKLNWYNWLVTYPSFKLRFFYDHDGTPTGLRYIRHINNVPVIEDYAYIVNPFKEVVGLSYHDNDSTSSCYLEAIYIYDAWGNHKVYNALGNLDTDEYSIGNLNSLRYKGYYYDKESYVFSNTLFKYITFCLLFIIIN